MAVDRTAIGLVLSALLLSSSAVAAQAGTAVDRVGFTSSGLRGFERIHLPAAPAPEIALAADAGYGFIESLGTPSGAHHRAAGSLALGAALTQWFGAGLRFDGRHDVHPDDGMGGDSGTVGDPRLLLRAGGAPSAGLLLGAEATWWVPGKDAPSLVFAASTLDLRATAALLPAHSAWSFAASAGYRLDNSAEAAPALDTLRPGDRLALALSSHDAVLAVLALAHRAGSLELIAEASWDVLVGDAAPSALDSPMRVMLGARVQLAAALQLAFAASVSPSGRPDALPADRLVPIEPRFALHAGLRYGFGARRASQPEPDELAAQASEPEPSTAAAPPPATSGALSGRVVDAAGAPVAGARVVLRAPNVGLETQSDAQGAYAFEDVPFGSVELTIEHPEHAPTSARIEHRGGSMELADQVLPPAAAGELRGLALSFRGKPVAARIVVRPLPPSEGDASELSAGADGRFRIELPPGRYQVEVGAPGFVSQTRKVEIEADGVVILNLDLRAER